MLLLCRNLCRKMMIEDGVYKDPTTMEPLYPEHNFELEALAIELIEKSSSLASSLHPLTASAIADFLRPMNSYYSNLIEGHDTHPIDIERALNKEFANDIKNRSLQLEALAHIKVSKRIFSESFDEEFNPYSTTFLKWIHQLFYDELPNEFRLVKNLNGTNTDVVPGEIRTCYVKVGKHIAPDWQHLDAFLNRFGTFYNPAATTNKSKIKRVIVMAAAHHRMAWIHPFVDGNGRVVRLLSDACFKQE